MFVSSEVSLPENLNAALEEFAATNPVSGSSLPIRVLFGRFRVTTPGPWTQEEAGACGCSLDVAQEHGQTIISWGSATAQHGREWHSLPGAFYSDNQERETEVRDIIVPQEGQPIQGLPYRIGGEDAPQIGEFSQRTVWFFINLAYIPGVDMLDVDSFLIEPIRRSRDSSVLADFQREREEASALAFATMMAGNPERRLTEARGRIETTEEQIRNHEQQVLTLRSTIELASRELDAVLATMNADPSHWRREWDAIARHPMIAPETLTMTGTAVQYDTTLLSITDQSSGSDVPLGRMRITIDLENAAVTIENLNNRRRDRDHPHVVNGGPCWGGYHSEVTDHIVNHRLSALVEFIFGYLQTYNPEDDWGRYFSYWRDAPELVSA